MLVIFRFALFVVKIHRERDAYKVQTFKFANVRSMERITVGVADKTKGTKRRKQQHAFGV